MAARAFLLGACIACSAYLALADAQASSPASAFAAADSNHDGTIDKKEWSTLEGKDKAGHLSSLTGVKTAAASLGSSFMKATWSSFSMILATEIGDRTFCIAAIMAMRYNRLTVFAGASGALIVMTVLSALIGVALPTFLPHTYTHYAAACLFAYFGVRLLKDASAMSGESISDELAEAEEEIDSKLGGHGGGPSSSPSGAQSPKMGSSSVPEGATAPSIKDDGAKSDLAKVRSHGTHSKESGHGWFFATEWPIFSQAFTLTFLAEWGDRSQIATIAMAAAQDPFGVSLGGFVGHCLCTGVAVLGGRLLASRISEKAVALFGGTLFVLFALHAFIVGPGE